MKILESLQNTSAHSKAHKSLKEISYKLIRMDIIKFNNKKGVYEHE